MAASRWKRYRRKYGKLLQPGWIGAATDEEMEVIQTKLTTDAKLARNWGFSPSWNKDLVDIITVEAIRAMAMSGDPDALCHNSWLVGQATRKARPPVEYQLQMGLGDLLNGPG